MFLIIYEGNTKILNFAFCILHLGDSSINYNLYFCTKQRESHMLKKRCWEGKWQYIPPDLGKLLHFDGK